MNLTKEQWGNARMGTGDFEHAGLSIRSSEALFQGVPIRGPLRGGHIY